MNGPLSFKMIDLYCGVGGLTAGFLDNSTHPDATFVARLMVDIDPEARSVVGRNFPRVPFLVADVHDVSSATLLERAGLSANDRLDLLVGGPPCQGFSWLGKRALEDERNLCLIDFMRLVKELRPLAAVIENVPLILTSHKGSIIQEIVDCFASMGYASCADILVASDFGVPQLRKRAVVLAYHSDLGVAPQLPKRTHERVPTAAELHSDDRKFRVEQGKLPYVSVIEAIGDLPIVRAGEGTDAMAYVSSPSSEYQRWARRGSIAIFNHRSRAHSDKYLRKISVIEEGGRNLELPDGTRFSDAYFSQAYARLHRHGIAQTITTSFGNPGSGRFIHYEYLRSITVREAARFQSFPDWFIFDGSHATQMRHVGNAVPPLLARAVRDQIARDFSAAGIGSPRTAGRRPRTPTEVTAERSRVMRLVPSKNTSVERLFRKALCDAEIRGYRLHSAVLPGKPDIIFPRAKIAVFLDGCFWHGCPRCYRAPKSRTEYWSMKVARNIARDHAVVRQCREAGWRVMRFWEHQIRTAPGRAVDKLENAIAATVLGRPPKSSMIARRKSRTSRKAA